MVESDQGTDCQEGRLRHATEHGTTAVVYILILLGLAFIFSPLWMTVIPRVLKELVAIVSDPVLVIFSLMAFLAFLWNVSFYLERRKELGIAKRIIRMYATQGKVAKRLDGEWERLDRVIITAIWELRNGYDLGGIIDRLQEETRIGEALPEGWARLHYGTAIDCLTDAAARNQVLDCAKKEWDLHIGEKMLWATRVENMRCRLQKIKSISI